MDTEHLKVYQIVGLRDDIAAADRGLLAGSSWFQARGARDKRSPLYCDVW